jgi:hypothetical protein
MTFQVFNIDLEKPEVPPTRTRCAAQVLRVGICPHWMVPTESVDLEGVPAAEFGTMDQLGHRRDVNAPVCGLYCRRSVIVRRPNVL